MVAQNCSTLPISKTSMVCSCHRVHIILDKKKLNFLKNKNTYYVKNKPVKEERLLTYDVRICIENMMGGGNMLQT